MKLKLTLINKYQWAGQWGAHCSIHTVKQGDVEVVKRLALDHWVDVNFNRKDRKPPLNISRYQNYDVIRVPPVLD